jgi:hypothetical protein
MGPAFAGKAGAEFGNFYLAANTCPAFALNPSYTSQTVSAMSQSTTAASASEWVAPSASAAS